MARLFLGVTKIRYSVIYKIAWTTVIYHIWVTWNAIIHKGKICSATDLVQTLLYMLLDIGSFGVEILEILSNIGPYATRGSFLSLLLITFLISFVMSQFD